MKPRNARVHFNMGQILFQGGRKEEALKHYEESLRIDPELAVAAERLKEIRRALSPPRL